MRCGPRARPARRASRLDGPVSAARAADARLRAGADPRAHRAAARERLALGPRAAPDGALDRRLRERARAARAPAAQALGPSFMKSGVLNTQLFSSTRRWIRQPAFVRTYSSTYQRPSMNTWDPPPGSGISCGLKHITRPVARSPSTRIWTFAFECCVFGNIGIAFLRNAIV